MSLNIGGVNEYVIKVDKNKLIKEVSEDINKVLEHCRSIGEAEGHNQILKMSEWGFKSYFPFISFSDSKVCISMVEFGEDGC